MLDEMKSIVSRISAQTKLTRTSWRDLSELFFPRLPIVERMSLMILFRTRCDRSADASQIFAANVGNVGRVLVN